MAQHHPMPPPAPAGTQGSRWHRGAQGGMQLGTAGLWAGTRSCDQWEGTRKIRPHKEVLFLVHGDGPGDRVSTVGKASMGDCTLFGCRGSDLGTGATRDQLHEQQDLVIPHLFQVSMLLRAGRERLDLSRVSPSTPPQTAKGAHAFQQPPTANSFSAS